VTVTTVANAWTILSHFAQSRERLRTARHPYGSGQGAIPVTADLDFPIDITRTQRKKSVSIQVKPNLVRVLAPKHLSEANLQALIAKRRPWIQKQIAAIQKAPPFLPKQYINGEYFNYLGNTYPLKVVASDVSPTSDAIVIQRTGMLGAWTDCPRVRQAGYVGPTAVVATPTNDAVVI